jgi:hypothetical protein
MKKILIIPLVILFLSGCSNSNNLANQEKCSKKSLEFFTATGGGGNFSNHYNDKLNKCFIDIIDVGSQAYSETLYDVYENKKYGGFYMSYEKNSEPTICWFLDKTCQSQNEFDEFVKQYMQNIRT